jgi:hypothetical protein
MALVERDWLGIFQARTASMRGMTRAQLEQYDEDVQMEVERVMREHPYDATLDAYLEAALRYAEFIEDRDEHKYPRSSIGIKGAPMLSGLLVRGNLEKQRDRLMRDWKAQQVAMFPASHAGGYTAAWPIIDGLTPYGPEESAGRMDP